MADGGSNWVTDLLDGAFDDAGGRIVKKTCDETEIEGNVVGRVRLTFTVEDLRGKTYEAKARVLLPISLREDPEAQLPVVFHCGYEADEQTGAKQVARGRISATTVQLPLEDVYPNAWSLVRGPKMEVVLAHLVRSLRFVDVGQVVYAGGSAGGYSALMTAAEAFPASAAIPGVPPTNLAYMGALWAANHARLTGTDAPSLTWFQGLEPAYKGWQDAFGEDYDAPGWLGHSPVGHVERITCPVATFFSMADPLVPIEQVDHEMALPFLEARPGDVEADSAVLTTGANAQIRLLDVLGARAELHVVPVPEGTPTMAEAMTAADLTMLAERPPFVLPEVEPVAGRWHVFAADEGEPVWVVSHFKHAYEPDLMAFGERALAGEVGVDQLTEAKLAQLLDRWSGTEWLCPGFPQLDRPEAERADVERGLRRYCSVSPAHAGRFRELYFGVEEERQVLPDDLVADLAGDRR